MCKDLRKLIGSIGARYYDFEEVDKDATAAAFRAARRKGMEPPEDPVFKVIREALTDDRSPAYWRLNCPNTFVTHSWLLEHLNMEYNRRFFHLTPQNLIIRNDVITAFTMFRLGQHDEFVWMGMTVIIIDGSRKLRKKRKGASGSKHGSILEDAIEISTKRPTAGLDYIRLVIQYMVKAYRAYIKGWTQVQDGQDVVVIRRTTEAGIDVGFVHFMDGKLTGLPGNDLMKNCMLPEVRSEAQLKVASNVNM